jgi:hypothetical protein
MSEPGESPPKVSFSRCYTASARPKLEPMGRRFLRRWGRSVFIVQGKPRTPEGIIKVIKETRQEALEAARDLLDNGMVIVTIIADGRVYTVEEFALTISNQMK